MKISLKKNNKGAALVAVIMTMLVLSLLSAAVLAMTTSNVRNGLEEREFQAAYYIAEAGANYGTEYYKNKILETYNDASINDAEGFYKEINKLTYEEDNSKILPLNNLESQYGKPSRAQIILKNVDVESGYYIIESAGTIGDTSRTVIKPFKLNWVHKGEGSGWQSEYAVFTFDALTINDGNIKGSVYSMEDLYIHWGVTIDGKAYSNKNIKNHGTIKGDIYSKGHIDVSGGTIEGNAYSNGDSKVTNGTIKGGLYSKEHIDVSGGTIKGDIYSKENIVISEWTTIEGNAYSEGNVVIRGGTIEGDVYSKKDIDISGGTIKGNIYSKENVVISGGTIEGDVSPSYKEIDAKFPAFPEFIAIPEEESPELPPEDPSSLYPEFPQFPNEFEERNPITTSYHEDSNENELPHILDLSPITYVPVIDVIEGRNLTINYSDGYILMVDDFTIRGTVSLEGTGLLKIYINDKLMLNTGQINYIQDIDDNVRQDMANNLSIYSKGTNISFTGTSNIVAKTIYAPDAKVQAGADGKIYGQVISSNLEMNGSNSFVKHNPSASGNPGGPSPSGPLKDVDLLIDLEPVTEK